MNSDGSGEMRLTNNIAKDEYPKWSPDGNKILFASARDLKEEIYIMDSDGNNQIRLTYSIEENSNPVFSPDGEKIAFLRWYDNGTNADIYIMNKDGTSETRITNTFVSEMLTGWK